MKNETPYDYVKRRSPEAYRRAVEIGSFAGSYVNYADPPDSQELAAKVEKAVIELVAQTIQEFSPYDREAKEAELKARGFEKLTKDQLAENRLVNFGDSFE